MLSKILSRHSGFGGCSTQRKEWQKLRTENEGGEERKTWQKRKKEKKKLKQKQRNQIKIM